MAPYLDGKAIMFRLANYRNNQLIDIEVQVLLSINESKGDKISRPFYFLELERSHINMLILSWTIVHRVNEKSPIWGFKQSDLDDGDVKLIILLKAFDDTFSQRVHSRTSYQYEEIVWNAKFVPIIEPNKDGILSLNMAGFSDFEKLDVSFE